MIYLAPLVQAAAERTSCQPLHRLLVMEMACSVVSSRQCDDTGTKQSCRSARSSADALAVFLGLELQPEIELQGATNLGTARTEFDHCADHRSLAEEPGHAVKHESLIIGLRKIVRLLADDAVTPPTSARLPHEARRLQG